MRIGFLALLEGGLPDEYVPRRCRRCGNIFERESAEHEPYCLNCRVEMFFKCEPETKE